MFRILRVSIRKFAKSDPEGDEFIAAVKDFLRPSLVIPKIKSETEYEQDRRDQNLAVTRSLVHENLNIAFDREIDFKRKLKMDAIMAMPTVFQTENAKPWFKPPAMPALSITPPIPVGHCWDPPQVSEDDSRARY
jgi:hypothetical protein